MPIKSFRLKRGIIILLLCFPMFCRAQHIAIKTNLLYDIHSTLNIGAEFRITPQWTLDISGNYNPFEWKNGRKMKHWLVQPEIRYWFCEAFNGHFIALHALGGSFNVGNLDLKLFPSTLHHRYQGNMFGTGIGYGYQFVINSRLNIELEIGGGWIQAHYDKYECAQCGSWLDRGKKNYFGITKAAVSLIYMLK